MTNIKTSKYLIDKIVSDADSGKMYIAIGSHNGISSNTINYSYNIIEDVKSKCIFGKKIKSSDISPVIKNNIWVSNTVYETSDDHVADDFFYILNQNNDVFKCIWNADGAPSTSEPLTKSTSYIETADSYIWKYMYTISSGDMSKFAFTGFIPVSSNSVVSNAAINESIDYIEVVQGGSNYSVYNTGIIQGNVGGNTYRIENSASAVNNIYANSAIYIKNGTSTGLLKTVSSSFSNSTGKYITFSTNTSLSTDSEYIISPSVILTSLSGSGFQAYAEVTENDSIDKIKIINGGSNYVNPEVSLVTSATVAPAQLRVITSPEYGHGYDPVEELGATRVVLAATFLKNENETLPETNFSYYHTSLIYNPNTNISEQNTISWGTSLDVNSIFGVNDKIIGNTSGAKGIVYWSNTSHIKLNTIVGSFSNNETIINQTGVNSTINIIKDKDIVDFSGALLQYTIHLDGVNRSDNVSESIKYIFKLEGN